MKKSERDRYSKSTEILEKYGNLHYFIEEGYSTTSQIAAYYDESEEKILQVISIYIKEFLKERKFISSNRIREQCTIREKAWVGDYYVEVDGVKVPIRPRGVMVYSREAVLRIGLLLDSDMAQVMRNELRRIYN